MKVEHIGSFPLRQIEATPIYLVTSVSQKHGHRCWGWFPTKEVAVEAVLKNEGDMWEAGYYPHVVIEKCHAGILALGFHGEAEDWFAWSGRNYEGGYKPCSKPLEFEGVVGFGMS